MKKIKITLNLSEDGIEAFNYLIRDTGFNPSEFIELLLLAAAADIKMISIRKKKDQ